MGFEDINDNYDDSMNMREDRGDTQIIRRTGTSNLNNRQTVKRTDDDDSSFNGSNTTGNIPYRAQDDLSESGEDNTSVYKYMDNEEEINDDRRISYYVNKQELG